MNISRGTLSTTSATGASLTYVRSGGPKPPSDGLWIRLMASWRKTKCRNDWHDYPDGLEADAEVPRHFYFYTCRHCFKRFIL